MVSRKVSESARRILIEQSRGGRGTGFAQLQARGGERFARDVLREVRRIKARTTSTTPAQAEELRLGRSARAGSELRFEAREKGFKSVKEFQAVSKKQIKIAEQKQKIIITKLPPRKKVISKRKVVVPPPKKPPSVVRLPTIPKGKAERGLRETQARLDKLLIQRQTADPKDKDSISREIKVLKESVKEFGLLTFITIKKIPSTIKSLIENPSQVKEIPSKFKRGAEGFGKVLRTEPTRAFVKVGGEILILKGTGKALQVTGKLGSKASARLSPKFVGIKDSKITIPSGQTGETIKINIAGRIGSPSLPTETLIKQAKISGKEVTAVSAQADKLISLVKTKRVIRKPIPNEELLSSKTKRLLNKFDKGKITKRQLRDLELRVRAEAKESLLERSLFADPKGRLRPSRLGREPKEATLLDILAGDVTFKTLKPQILIFEKVKIQQFPKTAIFKSIKKKFAQNKPLSNSETRALLEFQLKKSGKFKPIGSLTKEPEITIAPGEIIKKKKVLGVTLINGRKVKIIQAEIIKPSKVTARLLKKSKSGKITKKELRKLRSNLKRETGFKTSLSRRVKGKRIVRVRPLIRGRVTPRPRSKPPRRKRPPTRRARPPAKRRPGPRREISRGVIRPRERVRGRRGSLPSRMVKGVPTIRPKTLIPARLSLKRKKKKLKKKPKRPQAFQVWARPLKRTKKGRRPKLIKVNKVPLKKKRARDLRNYITDTSLSRTARIKPAKGKPRESKLKVPKGYARRTSGKFRRFRQVKGKRIPLPKGKVIEKGKHLLDTRQEKKQITLRKRIKQIRKPKKRKTIKRSRGIFG